MFTCERCGSNFSPVRLASAEYCPRCRAREGLKAPLVRAPLVDQGPKEGVRDKDEEGPEAPTAGKTA